MRISIAGVVVLVMTLYLFIKHKKIDRLLISLFTLNLLYEGFINASYFAVIGSQTFKIPDFLQLITAVVSFIVLSGRYQSKKLLVYMLAVVFSVVLLILRPYDQLVRTFNSVDFVNNIDYMHYPSFDVQTIKTTLRLLCFAWNVAATAKVITHEDWVRIRGWYFKVGRYVICYAWIEFVAKNIFSLGPVYKSLFAVLFDNDMSIVSSLSRNGVTVIVGFNNEPSQFAMMLFSYFIIYILAKEWERQKRKTLLLTLSAFILMFLCGSFRIVGMLPILVVLYMIISEKPVASIAVVSLCAIALVVLMMSGFLDYYLTRLGRATQFLTTLDATGIGSGEAGRLNTIVEALKVFIKRPLFGIGPGQTFAYGFIPSILVMTGLFGTIAWYGLMFTEIGSVSLRTHISRNNLLLLLVISISWIYTDSIAIGYSIYVVAIALQMRSRITQV